MTYAEWTATRTQFRRGVHGGSRCFVGTRLRIDCVGQIASESGADFAAKLYRVSVEDAQYAAWWYENVRERTR